MYYIIGDTVISEWSLVCERKQLNNIAEMVFLGGVALGGLVSGVISDKYGRKRTLMASVFLQTVIGKYKQISNNKKIFTFLSFT